MNPNDPPEIKVRVTPLEDTHQQEAHSPAEVVPARRMRARWSYLLLALLLLGLVGLAWWQLSRQNEATDGPSATIPRDAVARINAATPIPIRLGDGAQDSASDLSYAPSTEGWSLALQEAYRALQEGRYSSAISQYSALVGTGDPSEARDALWGLAASYEAASQTNLAIQAYSLFTALADPRAVRALYRLGRMYSQGGRTSEAIRAYEDYANRGGPAANAVRLMAAKLLGNTQAAEDQFKKVADSKPQDIDLRAALRGWAEVKSARKDYSGAIKLFDQLAQLETANPRPSLDYSGVPPQVRAAQEAKNSGDDSGARKRLLDYLSGSTNYISGRYSALEALLSIQPNAVVSGTVAPMLAANIAYGAGHYDESARYLDALRASNPASSQLPAASLLTGKDLWLSGDPASAYNWYTATVQTYPASPEAPEAMRRAGDMLSQQADWNNALAVYQDDINRYPNAGDQTALARLNGALLAYRLEQRDVALNMLAPLLSAQEMSPTLKSQAEFWTGKIQKSQGNPAWQQSLAQVESLDAGSFLDFRSRSILAGEPDDGPAMPNFAASSVITGNLGVRFDAEAAERQELLTWAQSLPGVAKALPTATPGTPATVTATVTGTGTGKLQGIEPRIASDPEAQRAVALLNLGDDGDAYGAFQALAGRLQINKDAAALAQLTIYLRYHASPQIAMSMAEALAALDTKGNPLDRPKLLLKTLYPTPYPSLVLGEAQLRDIDPLSVYALIRQESEFVPSARSVADARGLTQVMPSTGDGIAQQLGDGSYTTPDLYLPIVNIRYGVYYLASNLPQFNRKLMPTLAAYNGGPGNAQRWLAGSALFDPDLYVERIDLFETDDYLRRVYQNYGFYKLIYGR